MTEFTQDAREHYNRQEENGLRLEAHYQHQETRYKDEEEHHCHQAFKTSDYEEHKNRNDIRVDGTCRWVLDDPKFVDWRANPGADLLWISADPGCGKSVLARSLVDRDLRIDSPASAYSICYFFFKDNDVQNRLSTALCAILHQLFAQKPSLIQHAIPAWRQAGDRIKTEVDTLWRILEAATAEKQTWTVICVLDALDECRDEDRSRIITKLCDFYIGLAARTSDGGQLKILVTSRAYHTIQDDFKAIPESLPSIRLRGESKSDQMNHEINMVATHRVNAMAKQLSFDATTKKNVTDSLLSMKHRTYLWLHLTIDEIQIRLRDSLRPAQESADLLRSLPTSVEDAYEQILERVTRAQQDNVKKIFLIILGARRALTVTEMALALGIATDTSETKCLTSATLDADRLRNNICQWCGLFVFISHDRLYLIHQTAKEFLLRTDAVHILRDSSWKHCLTPRATEDIMMRICVELLLTEDLEQVLGIDLSDSEHEFNGPNVSYGRSSWQDELDNGSHGGIADFEVTDKRSYENKLHETKSTVDWSRHVPLRKAPYVCSDQSDSSSLAEAKGRSSTESLFQYSVSHWASHVRSSDLQAKDSFFATVAKLYVTDSVRNQLWLPLFWEETFDDLTRDDELERIELSSLNGHDMFLSLFLGKKQASSISETAAKEAGLIWAAYSGHLICACLLVEAGVNVNAQRYYKSPLTAAAAFGHIQIVQLLLKNNAEVNARSQDYGSALRAAASGGYLDVVKHLLESNADVNDENDGLGTALQAAAFQGHFQVVEVLFGYNADPNIMNALDECALFFAVNEGYLHIARLLLQNGADVNARSTRYPGALYCAARSGNLQMVKLLLEHNADINAPSGSSVSVLSVAVKGGHTEVALHLIKNNAQVNTPVSGYTSVFELAVVCGQTEVVEELIARGADPKAVVTTSQWTPLHLAVRHGHAELVKRLTELGAELEAKTSDGSTPLLIAAPYGQLEVMSALIEMGADSNAVASDGSTTLHLLIKYHHHRSGDHKSCDRLVLQKLIEAGADLEARCDFGCTPLFSSIFVGCVTATEILLQLGANINAALITGLTPLRAAVRAQSWNVFEILVAYATNHSLDVGRDSVFLSPPSSSQQSATVTRFPEASYYRDDQEFFECCLFGILTNSIKEHEYINLLRARSTMSIVEADFDAVRLDPTDPQFDFLQMYERFGQFSLPKVHSDRNRYLPRLVFECVQSVVLAQSMFDWIGRGAFRPLGRMLNLLSLVKHAALALRLSLVKRKNAIYHSVTCDMCNSQKLETVLYACGQCQSVDLCEGCFARYRQGHGLDRCVGHYFIEVLPIPWDKESVADNFVRPTKRVRSWLKEVENDIVTMINSNRETTIPAHPTSKSMRCSELSHVDGVRDPTESGIGLEQLRLSDDQPRAEIDLSSDGNVG